MTPIKMTLKEVHDNALRQTAAPRCRFRALCGWLWCATGRIWPLAHEVGRFVCPWGVPMCGWLAKGRCEDGRDSAALRLRHLLPPAGVQATPLGSCSRRSFGPLVCFRYPPSGERAPRPPDNKNSQLLAQPAAWSQKGCGEDEIRTRGTE